MSQNQHVDSTTPQTDRFSESEIIDLYIQLSSATNPHEANRIGEKIEALHREQRKEAGIPEEDFALSLGWVA